MEKIQIIREILEIINKDRVSRSKISKETEIPYSRFCNWLNDSGARPKDEDVKKLKTWVKNYVNELADKHMVYDETAKKKDESTIMAEVLKTLQKYSEVHNTFYLRLNNHEDRIFALEQNYIKLEGTIDRRSA